MHPRTTSTTAMCVQVSILEFKDVLNFILPQSKHTKSIKTSILHVNGKPNLVTSDYEMDVSGMNAKKFDEEIV